MIEGVIIAFLLSWEIFWLSRMYKVLWNMPTAKQVQEMVEIIKRDRDTLIQKVQEIVDIVNEDKEILVQKVFDVAEVLRANAESISGNLGLIARAFNRFFIGGEK
jgi:translation initiation factor 2 beta subunit (eIF-2beta)/eIF-5